MSKEELNQLAKSEGIPEEELISFRLGFYFGKQEAITETQKIIARVFENSEQNALSKYTRDAFLSSGHATDASDEDLREGVKDDIQEATKNFVEL